MKILVLTVMCVLYGSSLQNAEAGASMIPFGSQRKLVLVEEGKSLAPIVVFKDAPPFARQAADELAEYIEKIAGAKPAVIEGCPDPVPEHAVWVGVQPVVRKLFPEIDLEFRHPEEILIAAGKDHLLIAGRDVWDPDNLVVKGKRKMINGKQQEYGTCNAVYTFLQDYLDVRWLWPGESGEDIIERKTIAFAPFVYRYHPQVQSRGGLFNYSQLGQGGRSARWSRRQRIQLDSFSIPAGHAFHTWWNRFHETHPDYFALQPDGTRCGWPGPRTAKLCQSNPKVWDEWLRDVEAQLEKDPNLKVFSISPNDGSCNGVCTCEKCRAWDCLEAGICLYNWQAMGQEYVVMSDRYQTFASHLGRKLKERYPDKDYQMLLHAYGASSSPAPVRAKPLDNLIISYVGNFPWGTDERREADKERIRKWIENGAGKMIYRPNVSRQPALPEVFLKRTVEDFRFLAEQNYIGIFIDMIWEHWATCGPQYYLMAQLVWNPWQDGWAVLDDYYRRGFGPAAKELKAYWTLFDNARDQYIKGEPAPYTAPYSMEVMKQARALLDRAAAKAADQPRYRERVAFVRAGLDCSLLMVENYELMSRVRDSEGEDTAAADAVRANWEKIKTIAANHKSGYPMALNETFLRPGHGRYTKNLHPDFPYGVHEKKQTGKAGKTLSLKPAGAAGWKLVFADEFDRTELGNDWTVVEGAWRIVDGALRGSGMLVTRNPHLYGEQPSCQRVEFDVSTDVEQALFVPGRELKIDLCDMTAMIHAKPPVVGKGITFTGYLFQFGGFHNTVNRILRDGADCALDRDPEIRIGVNQRHRIVVESDRGQLRHFVDGKPLNHCVDKRPIAATIEQGRVGFYLYTASKIFNVKVYAKPE